VVTWAVAGLIAFAIARVLKSGGALTWRAEAGIAVGAAMVFGLIATAFDFGGWRELEWRSALFALAGSSVILALGRAAHLATANRR
jgi:hypothetical protein